MSADEEFRRVQAVAEQIADADPDDYDGIMIVAADHDGITTTPYVHKDDDPREMSLWLLGAVLAHIDDSTPPAVTRAQIASHAIALMQDPTPDVRGEYL